MDNKTNLTPQINHALRATAENLTALTSGRLSLLNAFVDSQQRTMERLAAVEKQLAKVLSADDPEVLKVRNQREQSARFVTGITTALKRAQSLTLAKDGQQTFAGTVRNTSGAPVRGILVQLVALAGKEKKKVGETKTNQFGDFSINAPLSELNPKAAWKLIVQNEGNEILASQPVVVDTTKGVISFVRLTLQLPRPAQDELATQPASPVVAQTDYATLPKSVKPRVRKRDKDKPLSAPQSEGNE